MANDRLYLRCPCGETHFLAKWWGSGFGRALEDLDHFSDWLDKHAWCDRPEGKECNSGRAPWFDTCGEGESESKRHYEADDYAPEHEPHDLIEEIRAVLGEVKQA